jgi:hypothetical protein
MTTPHDDLRAMDWKTYDATRVDSATVDSLAQTALHMMRRDPEASTTYATTGDTIVVATRDDDGGIQLLECLVRREAGVLR